MEGRTTTAASGAPVRDAQRLLADVQRLADIGYWEWDVGADRITWSDELYRLYGADPEGFDPTYDAYLERIHPEDRTLVDDVVQRAYRTGHDYSVEHRIVRDGEVRWLMGRGTVEVDDGRVVRLFGVTMDITERKRSEAVLRSFISNAAHELRTPIAAIAGAVELLLESGWEAGDVHDEAAGNGELLDDRGQVLAVLNRQVTRMRELSEDLLDLTALDERVAPVLLTPISLGPVVGRALAAVGVADASVDIDDGVVVMAGVSELELSLVHLLTNAVQHGGPNIEITGRREGEEVTITVADDGAGVPPGVRESLFTPFSRGVGSTGRGTGLGLAIVRRLVAMQGGSIAYRAGEGGGACFTVRLGAAT